MRAVAQILLLEALQFAFCIFTVSSLSAQVIDTAEIDSMLAQNRADLMYLDVVASNLPTDLQPPKSELQKQVIGSIENAVTFDFFARMWQLQGQSGNSFRQLRASRVSLRDGYRLALGYYIDTAWVLLESSAPGIISSEDPLAGHYLKLGFRDLEAARILFRQGIRYPKESPTLAIRAYIDGLQRIRRGRRYGLLALIESRTPVTEKDRFRTVSLDDLRESATSDKDNRTYFQVVQDRLINLISRKILQPGIGSSSRGYAINLNLLEVHEDNYGRLYHDRTNQLDRIFDSLDVGAFHRNESLPKRNKSNRFDIPASDSDPIESVRDIDTNPGNSQDSP
mgnify:CR=1 FL=1